MATLKRHAKRGEDKPLAISGFYTSAHNGSKSGGWESSAHIRFTDENCDARYSAKFSMVEAARIAVQFADYVRKYGDSSAVAALDKTASEV